MSDLETLFQFLQTILPGDVVTKAVTLIPVVTALVGLARLVPWVKARVKWAAPALSILLGLLAGLLTVGLHLVGAGTGLLIGIGAIGGFSGAKNMAQAARSAFQDRKAA